MDSDWLVISRPLRTKLDSRTALFLLDLRTILLLILFATCGVAEVFPPSALPPWRARHSQPLCPYEEALLALPYDRVSPDVSIQATS